MPVRSFFIEMTPHSGHPLLHIEKKPSPSPNVEVETRQGHIILRLRLGRQTGPVQGGNRRSLGSLGRCGYSQDVGLVSPYEELSSPSPGKALQSPQTTVLIPWTSLY